MRRGLAAGEALAPLSGEGAPPPPPSAPLPKLLDAPSEGCPMRRLLASVPRTLFQRASP